MDIESLDVELPKKAAEAHFLRKRVQLDGEKCFADYEDYRMYIEPPPANNQSIFIRTWGCSHNTSESEYMAGLLAEYGYRIVGEPALADLWILNSCTVKNPSEDMLKNLIQQGVDLSKPLVITGCIPKSDKSRGYMRSRNGRFLNENVPISVLGSSDLNRIVEVVEQTFNGNSVSLYGPPPSSTNTNNNKALPKLSLPKIRKNDLIEIISISTGCLNNCTYCKTKYARGELVSYPVKEIIGRVTQAVSEGVVEIWITSEDVGAYGKDIGTSISDLLFEVIKVLPPHVMLRIGMTNPPYILDQLKQFVEIFKSRNVYSFLHVPVQSGSDDVLNDMNREYGVEQFEHIVDLLQLTVPNITIATDIICAFPTESEEDFERTYNLIEKYKFKVLFINKFYPRPGTVAAKMRRIENSVAKQRTVRLTNLFRSYMPYEDREGHLYSVLFTEVKNTNNNDGRMEYIGHNRYYEQVHTFCEENLLGKWALIKIVKTTKFCMIGEFLKLEKREKKQDKKKHYLNPIYTELIKYLLIELVNLFL